jgi:hypothetical protein
MIGIKLHKKTTAMPIRLTKTAANSQFPQLFLRHEIRSLRPPGGEIDGKNQVGEGAIATLAHFTKPGFSVDLPRNSLEVSR